MHAFLLAGGCDEVANSATKSVRKSLNECVSGMANEQTSESKPGRNNGWRRANSPQCKNGDLVLNKQVDSTSITSRNHKVNIWDSLPILGIINDFMKLHRTTGELLQGSFCR